MAVGEDDLTLLAPLGAGGGGLGGPTIGVAGCTGKAITCVNVMLWAGFRGTY